jgi:alpha-galactosidase
MEHMEQVLDFQGLALQITADEITKTGETVQLKGARVRVKLPRPPVRYFRHGWQSWSLAAWTGLSPLPLQRPFLLRPMQGDPVYAAERLPHSSWCGAVEFEDGSVLLLGALDLETHVRLDGDALEGWSESSPAQWLLGYGAEGTVFGAYVERLGKVLGRIEKKPAPRVWCSWYSLYTAIDEPLLGRIFDGLGDLPFDVLQVDDGWQISVGDWEANSKFPSGVGALAEKIKSTGRRAGLWLAPLIAVRSSRLFGEHPEWFLKDERGAFASAGFNWGEQLYALDTTHPAGMQWLAALMRQVRAWGFDYIKLDFLYAGALPGSRYSPIPREQAYRKGLDFMHQAMGDDAYFLACGAPVLPSLGLCDALRVGPDVGGEWESRRDSVLLNNFTTPGTRNAIRTTLHQLWLAPLVRLDPDVAYFASRGNSLTAQQKRLLQDLALICGFKATSDLPQWLTEREREQLRLFLQDEQTPVRTGRYSFRLGDRLVDFSEHVTFPAPVSLPETLLAPFIRLLSEQPWALRLFDQMGKGRLEKLKKELLQ